MSTVNTVLCTIIAESFNAFSEAIEKGSTARQVATDALKDGGLKAIFNGNNYSPEWREEAEKRGLSCVDSVVDGSCQWYQESTVKLFQSLNVMSEKELTERADVLLENYVITVEVEARCLVEMINRQIVPVAKTSGLDSTQAELLAKLIEASSSLQEKVEAVHEIEEFEEQAKLARDLRLVTMVEVRTLCDQLEAMVPASTWPIASYTELLFDDMNEDSLKFVFPSAQGDASQRQTTPMRGWRQMSK